MGTLATYRRQENHTQVYNINFIFAYLNIFLPHSENFVAEIDIRELQYNKAINNNKRQLDMKYDSMHLIPLTYLV